MWEGKSANSGRREWFMYSTQAGTLGYCAPERLNKKCKYTTKVDMWGAGLVLYEMLIGCHPFDIENA